MVQMRDNPGKGQNSFVVFGTAGGVDQVLLTFLVYRGVKYKRGQRCRISHQTSLSERVVVDRSLLMHDPDMTALVVQVL